MIDLNDGDKIRSLSASDVLEIITSDMSDENIGYNFRPWVVVDEGRDKFFIKLLDIWKTPGNEYISPAYFKK